MSADCVRRALLIGIDCYMPNELPDGTSYPHLAGCVRDVNLVEVLLTKTLGVKPEHLIKLTASGDGLQPTEPNHLWPTYANIVAAFQSLTASAHPGDLVYIHFSGHGGRAATVYPEIKNQNGLDESLVPADIDHGDGQYLRDLEVAHLLAGMVAKELVVTVVLDCCHSGGMTRAGSGVAARGIASADHRPRSHQSLVAPGKQLIDTWRDLTNPAHARVQATRSVTSSGGWLPEPKGYTLLSACRANEIAYEQPFDEQGNMGALTYWMLDSVRDIGPGLSYKVLHDRIVAKVHGQFASQTPQLQGEGDRIVFGIDRVKAFYAVNVIRTEGDDRVLLAAGQAHGLGMAARFAVFPHGTTVFDDATMRLATVKVTQLGATESWADVEERAGDASLEAGSQAVLASAGRMRLIRKVTLVRAPASDALDDEAARAALDSVADALAEAGWVRLANSDETPDFQVGVDRDGAFEILDPAGQPIPRLRPPIRTSTPDAAIKVVRRLEHLAKYRALRELSNFDAMSPLAHGLDVTLTAWAETYEPGEPFEGQPLAPGTGLTVLCPGWWVALRIRNNASVPLNVSVFNLQPGWGAKQIWPYDASSFRLLDPRTEELLPLQASLLDEYDEGEDILKVFATVGTTDFRWLELPPLDTPSAPLRVGRAPVDELERLFSAFSADRPATRNFEPPAQASRSWTTEQVTLAVRRTAAITP
jgi:hypothetical protein